MLQIFLHHHLFTFLSVLYPIKNIAAVPSQFLHMKVSSYYLILPFYIWSFWEIIFIFSELYDFRHFRLLMRQFSHESRSKFCFWVRPDFVAGWRCFERALGLEEEIDRA